ncbi:MAG: alpha/beta fold hydrolase [Candidatus Omnitrophota bacterium]
MNAHKKLENIPDVIDRSNYLTQNRILLDELKDKLKEKLALPPKKRYEIIPPPKKLLEAFMHNIMFLSLMKITRRKIIKWFRMNFLEKLYDDEGGFVPGLSMVAVYSWFLDDFKKNLWIFDKTALTSHRAAICRNRFIAELDRTLFYTREALSEDEGKIKLKAYAAGMGLNALMTLMILRDENPSYMDRLEFTITDIDERNIKKIEEIARLCELEENINTFIEDINNPVIKEGVFYHVQTAIGIVLYLSENRVAEHVLRNMKKMALPNSVIILDCQVKHHDRLIQEELQSAGTKLRCPETMLNLAKRVGLEEGPEYDRHLGCALYQALPVMVFKYRPYESWDEKEKYVTLEYGDKPYNLYYQKRGVGETPIILVHGLGESGECWSEIIDALAEKFTVYALDLPGFGRSDKLPTRYTTSRYAEIINDFTEKLGLSKVIIAGHSMGGSIAVNFQQTHPEKVHKLILVSSSTIPLGSMPVKLLKTAYKIPALGPAVHRVIKNIVGSQKWIRSLVVDKSVVLELSRELKQSSRRAVSQIAFEITNQNRTEVLKSIEAPTILIWGKYDSMRPLSMGKRTEALIPSAKLFTIDSGHYPQLEKPEDVINALIKEIES